MANGGRAHEFSNPEVTVPAPPCHRLQCKRWHQPKSRRHGVLTASLRHQQKSLIGTIFFVLLHFKKVLITTCGN
jgi:hypothetical protein